MASQASYSVMPWEVVTSKSLVLIQVDDNYKWCLFVSVLMCLHYTVVAGLTGKGRKDFT